MSDTDFLSPNVYMLNHHQTVVDYVQGTDVIPIYFVSTDYDIPQGVEGRIYIHKPSGKIIYNMVDEISDNVVIVTPTTQMFAEYGQHKGNLEFIKDGKKLATFPILFNIYPNYRDEGALESKDEYEALIYYMKLSKSYAIGGSGIRDGEDTDNSKYYQTQSKSWTQGGTGARSGEDTNNATYWATMSRSYTIGGTGKRFGEDTDNSKYYQTQSKSYAIGDTGARIGEDTDNSKYYQIQSKSWAQGETGARSGEDTDNAKYFKIEAESWAHGTTGQRTGEDTNNAEYHSKMSRSYATGDGGVRTGEATDSSKYYKEQSALKATESANSAKLSESWAHGETNVRDDEATDNAKYWADVARERALSTIKPKGTVTFDNIPTTGLEPGFMYNISNEFITDSRFKEGAGHDYPSGTNIYWTTDDMWDVFSGTGVTGIKGSAESSFRNGNVIITKTNIGLGNVDDTKDADKHVAYAESAGNGVDSVEDDGEKITMTLTNGDEIELPAKAGDVGVELTLDEYNALSEEERNNGTVYYIKDYPGGSTSIKDLLGHTRTNLLNQTLQTTTSNGITCTNNGDGTYTLDGPATSELVTFLIGSIPVKNGMSYRICGCPQGGSSAMTDAYRVTLTHGGDTSDFVVDTGNGATFTSTQDENVDLYLTVAPNTIVTNLTFKPMLTTDLTAGYDDFVGFSGNGELNENVAEIFNTFFDMMHPVGELYITTSATFNPNTATGWKGTWVRDKGRFVRLAGDDDTIGSTGGADNRTLTTANLPSHYHGLNNHKHTIPALRGTAASDGKHQHYAVANRKGGNTAGAYGNANPNYGIGVYNDGAGDQSYTLFNADISDIKELTGMWTGSTNSTGDHIHSVTTTASTTGGNNGNTAATGSGTAFDNRPFHENYYGWRRTK